MKPEPASPRLVGTFNRTLCMRFLAPALLLLAAAPLEAQTPAPAAPPAAAPAPVKLTPEQEAKLLTLGKKYTKWFLSGQADSLMAVFDAESISKMGGVEGLRTVMAQVAERGGVESKIVEEKMTYRRGQPQFWHAGEFSEFGEDQLVIRWILTVDGKIIGAGVGPKGQTPAPDGM